MKKLLLITVAFLFCGNVFSQIEIVKESEMTMDQMLEKVDKAKFTSGILMDRSQNYSNISQLNTQEKVVPINYSYFKQALLDLYNASNKKMFISSKSLKDGFKNKKREDNIVDFGIISADFESLNYNPNDESLGGLKLVNGKFEQQKDKEAFISHTALVISPLKIAAKGNVITYRFNKEFWFNNSEKTMQSLVVHFNDETTYEIIKDGKIVINELQQNYNVTGEKIIQFEVLYVNGEKLKTSSKIHIIVNDASSNRTGAIGNSYVLADASESFQGYDEPSSIRGRIDYRTYYHTNNGNNSATLLKPLIIIDGFDPQNKRRIEDVDCANDPSCVSLYNGQFSYANHRSIFDLMQPTDGSPNLVGRLRDIGYDVIIVNHPTYVSGGRTIDGGADFIERNGLALTRLIRNLNTTVANNGSNEELVIVGPSMGGQISRYALSYMEKKYQETNQAQWLHNTRLWISVDSPHLGANIPLGVQAFINQAKDDSDSAQDFADNQLGSPAAKQQLIEQYNGTSSSHLNARTVSQGYSYSRGSTFFQQFYNNLFNNGLAGSKGYPQNLRKIALVNGSLTGSKAYENPFTNNANDSYANHSEQTVNMRAFQRINIIPFTNFTEHIASIETYFLPNTSSYGKISRFKKSFNDASVYMTNSNSRGNMDNVSGGWFPAQYDLAKPTIGTNPTNASGSFWASFEDALANVVEGISGLLGGSYWSLRTLKHSSSFIASFSAIGHTSPDRSWAQALDKNLVCQNLTPFDSYFGHDKNTQHTSFNAESVAWLLAELGGNQLDPYFPVAQSALVGPNPMCSAGQAVTYAFQSCSAPGDVQTWSVSNNLTVVSSNGNAITVIAATNYKGNGWINASFNNGVVVQKEIWIGKPNIYVDFENDPDLYNWANFSIEGVGGTDVMNQEITSIDWTELSTVGYANLLVSDGDYEGSGHGSGNTWRIEAKVDVTNACGTTTKYMTITPPPPGNNPCRQMVSYKVKTISKAVYYINKVIEDPCKQGSAKESESNDRFETFVYDFTGNLVFKTTSRTIDLTKHKPGMYVLKVFVNNELISTKKVAKS